MELEKAIAKFWSKVAKGTDTECWLWLGSIYGMGYGKFECKWVDNKKAAHRFSYILAKGPIPAGLLVLHTCDNPPCVNPNHLFLGTSRDNAQDRESKGRGDLWTARYARTPESFKRGDEHWTRKNPEGLKYGTANPSAKLNEDAVRDIRRRLAAGESGPKIAAIYDVAATQIYYIKHGQTWKHVQ